MAAHQSEQLFITVCLFRSTDCHYVPEDIVPFYVQMREDCSFSILIEYAQRWFFFYFADQVGKNQPFLQQILNFLVCG